MITESCKELEVPWKEVDLGQWKFIALQGQQTLRKQNRTAISSEHNVIQILVPSWSGLIGRLWVCADIRSMCPLLKGIRIDLV